MSMSSLENVLDMLPL